MGITSFLQSPTVLPGWTEDIPGNYWFKSEQIISFEFSPGQWTTAHFIVTNLGVLGVLRTNGSESLTIGSCLLVVEVANHLISLDIGLVQRPIGGLRLELIEAGLHMTYCYPVGNILEWKI